MPNETENKVAMKMADGVKRDSYSCSVIYLIYYQNTGWCGHRSLLFIIEDKRRTCHDLNVMMWHKTKLTSDS